MTGVERFADEPAPLCPPGVADGLSQLLPDQFREFVFETIAPLTRKWQVVGGRRTDFSEMAVDF